MRLPLFLIAIFLIVDFAVDGYIFRAIRKRVKRHTDLWLRVHVTVAIAFIIALCTIFFLPVRSGSDETLRIVMWILYSYLTIYAPKIIWIIFDLAASFPRIFTRNRIKWISRAGCVVASIVFIMMWWGALVNRFNIDIHEVDVDIPDLPAAFENYRIVQFSDLHTGTYGNDTSYVSKIVDRINSLHPDLIVFTGDIVNRKTDELKPFVGPLSRLHAPDGVISILGNHDYGDYSDWKTPAEKQQNMKMMYSLQEKMGWNLLLNESISIKHGNDSIIIIGVENIGDPPFHVYGSLAKAYPDVSDSNTKILLSHNPAHWTDSIAGHPDVNIPLTLSGHTHAMQIEIGSVSPAALRYKTWGGLYDDHGTTDNLLYVNIGIGTVGMPMRIGATPEITVITLKRKQV